MVQMERLRLRVRKEPASDPTTVGWQAGLERSPGSSVASGL